MIENSHFINRGDQLEIQCEDFLFFWNCNRFYTRSPPSLLWKQVNRHMWAQQFSPHLDSMAWLVIFKAATEMAIIIPVASFSITARVASGVTSLLANPVPPVVRIKFKFKLSAQSHSVLCDKNITNINRGISYKSSNSKHIEQLYITKMCCNVSLLSSKYNKSAPKKLKSQVKHNIAHK